MARRSRSTFGRIYRRKGRPGYYIRVRIHGKEVTRWGGPDRKTAAELLADLLRKTAREDLLGERAVSAVTFAEFEPVLEQHFRARHSPTTVASELGRLRRIVAWFGDTPLMDIGAGELQGFVTALRNEEGFSVASTNRYASLLSVAFKLAVQKGFARTNPVQGVERQKEAERPVPYLSGDDIGRLVARAQDERFGALIRVLADTGLRRAEALALEWRDVDLGRGCLLVRKSKNRRTRQIELSKRATETFRWLQEGRGPLPLRGVDLVWHEWREKGPQAVSSRFGTVARRAGFEGLRLHDLRHGFCSRLAQAGVPLATIAALAGHTTWMTTQRYASHVPEGATRAAIRQMDTNEREADERAKQGS